MVLEYADNIVVAVSDIFLSTISEILKKAFFNSDSLNSATPA